MRPWKSAPGGREPRRRALGPAKPPPHKTWEHQLGTCSAGTSLEDCLHPLSTPHQAVGTAHPEACTDLSGTAAAGLEAAVSAPTPPLHPHCPGEGAKLTAKAWSPVGNWQPRSSLLTSKHSVNQESWALIDSLTACSRVCVVRSPVSGARGVMMSQTSPCPEPTHRQTRETDKAAVTVQQAKRAAWGHLECRGGPVRATWPDQQSFRLERTGGVWQEAYEEEATSASSLEDADIRLASPLSLAHQSLGSSFHGESGEPKRKGVPESPGLADGPPRLLSCPQEEGRARPPTWARVPPAKSWGWPDKEKINVEAGPGRPESGRKGLHTDRVSWGVKVFVFNGSNV